MQAHDHRIPFPPFSITRGPKFANQKLTRPLPQKNMIETGKLLRWLQLLPRARIDLPSNAIHIKQRLGNDQTLRLQPQIFDMIIPSRMLAERREPHIPPARAKTATIFNQEFFEEVAHFNLEKPPSKFSRLAT